MAANIRLFFGLTKENRIKSNMKEQYILRTTILKSSEPILLNKLLLFKTILNIPIFAFQTR